MLLVKVQGTNALAISTIFKQQHSLKLHVGRITGASSLVLCRLFLISQSAYLPSTESRAPDFRDLNTSEMHFCEWLRDRLNLQ
jgi:hypothetical protein